jgi:Fur family zinc uptake transcriptional regulator/Fur family ferric uptake transcriptional regulator
MFKELLQKHKVHVTDQRIKILDALQKHNKPVTIETLHLELTSSMNKTTLYRSLSSLVAANIVYQTDFREGVAYFELQGAHHHHHLVCTNCKSKQAINYCPSIPAEIEEKEGFIISNHIFEIFGLCKNCSH